MPARVRQLLLGEAVSLELLCVACVAGLVLLIADEGDGRRGGQRTKMPHAGARSLTNKKNCRGYVPRHLCSGRERRGTTHTHTGRARLLVSGEVTRGRAVERASRADSGQEVEQSSSRWESRGAEKPIGERGWREEGEERGREAKSQKSQGKHLEGRTESQESRLTKREFTVGVWEWSWTGSGSGFGSGNAFWSVESLVRPSRAFQWEWER